MKQKILNNFWLKVTALFLAVILWLVIVSVEDPMDTKTFSGISVTTQNESVITNEGKIYQVQNGTDEVAVTVTANRSTLSRISKDEIQAIADFSNLSLESLVPITVKIPAYEGKYSSAEAMPRNLQISLEDNESVTLPISVSTQGELAEGHFVESTTVEPDSITISGPKSLVQTISNVVVTVDVSGLEKTQKLEGTLTYFNASDESIDPKLLTLDLEGQTVSVKVKVLPVKTVPIIVSAGGEPETGYELTSLSVEPDTIDVVGKAASLHAFDELVIPEDALDLTGATDDVTAVINIEDYLPEGITLAEGQRDKLMLTAVVELIGTRTVDYPVGSIVVLHAPSGYKISYDGISELNLTFQGSEEALRELEPSNIDVTMDLEGLNRAGKYELEVKAVPKNGCKLVKNIIVNITLEAE